MIDIVRPCKNYGVLLRMDDCGEPTLLCLNCAENQGYIAWNQSQTIKKPTFEQKTGDKKMI